jgi:NADP-dependent 3-hydroxy acid dehydrogenase YdfG
LSDGTQRDPFIKDPTALPVFRKQGFGHFVNTASTAGLITMPNTAVYSATKFAVRAISEGLRQEAGDKLRVTTISQGFVQTNLANSIATPATKAQIAGTCCFNGLFDGRRVYPTASGP